LTSAFGPVAVTLAIVGGDFLGLWISPEAAREATSVLRLLCAAGIGGLAGVAPIFFAMGTGRSHWQAPFSLVVGLVLTAGSVALVPHFGLRGIGLAFALAVAVRCGLVMLLWRALFRPDVSAVSFAIHIFAPASGALALLVAGVMAHDAIHHSPGWLALVVEGAAVFVTAALLQFGFGEALPNGRTRRRSVVESFRPVVVRAIERARGFERP
jgi:O-antigen/teichoic acid export membrane protein